MDVYAALADPVRRTLLRQLAVGPARVVDLAADHPISRPAISRHLRTLTEAGLVAGETRGRERHYRLVLAALAPMADFVAELAELAEPAETPRPRPPIAERHLDALGLEVRRTGRERAHGRDATNRTDETEETA